MVIHKERWAVEKKISLGTAALILAQTLGLAGVGAWYMSALEKRVDYNSELVQQNKRQIETVRAQQAATDNNAARFDERLIAFDHQLKRFDVLIDKLNEKSHRAEASDPE